MATNGLRKERLSIYLARPDVEEFSSLLRPEAEAQSHAIEVAGFSDARLYIRNSAGNALPTWTNLFTSNGVVPARAFVPPRSVGALLVLKNASNIFAITFGVGYHLLNTEAVVRDFGVRVVLGSVDSKKLRSLDKASYEQNPLNSRVQSTTEVGVFDLEMDTESEMLYAVVGVSRERLFGERIAGRDALVLVTDADLDGFSQIVAHAVAKYNSGLPNQFAWFNNIRRVISTQEHQRLDRQLNELLSANNFSLLWLGEPEIVDWETHVGYSFDLMPRTPRHAVLTIDKLREYAQSKGIPLTVESLREISVHVNDHEYKSVREWSAYRCLYAEITSGGCTFILRNGVWFRVDRDFSNSLNEYIDDIPSYAIDLPVCEHRAEKDYNASVARNRNDMHLMDRSLVYTDGRHGPIEFCDILANQSDIIHVKFYTGSATLSHLFYQGQVSAQLFIEDANFRASLNPKLPATWRLPDTDIRPSPANYRVVFGIATNKAIPQELPFFAKITLRNAVKALLALGYSVSLARIPLGTSLLAQQNIRPRKPRRRRASRDSRT